jgi:hypothetical protein
MYSAETLGGPAVPKDHSECSTWLCNLDQVDERNYTTRHVLTGCDCEFVGPYIEKIVTTLERGGIPIISYQEHDGQLNITVLSILESQQSYRRRRVIKLIGSRLIA